MRKIIVPLVILLLVIGVGVLGYFKIQEAKAESAVQQEITAQKQEDQECRRRLALFYQAWKHYAADHKGAEPATIEALIPRYLPDPKLLICPTAERWATKRRSLNQGNITIDKTSYPVTYGFQWLIPKTARSLKRAGDRALLVTCQAHEEALYRAVFNKAPQLGAFDAEQRTHYVPELQNARMLAVRRNGTVEEVEAGKEE